MESAFVRAPLLIAGRPSGRVARPRRNRFPFSRSAPQKIVALGRSRGIHEPASNPAAALTDLILATASPIRRALLANAGVAFRAEAAGIDERALEAPLLARGATPAEIAIALADEKALAVSRLNGDALVIGADQTLDSDGHRGTKSATLAEARRQLMRLAGRAHHLHAALALARAGTIVWRHLESPRLVMRALSAQEIDAYLARVSPDVLQSVGVYQIEGAGIQLFDAIDGDWTAIQGLPLLPLIKALRAEGALP